MSYPGQTPMGIPGMPPMPYMVGAPPPIIGGVMPMSHMVPTPVTAMQTSAPAVRYTRNAPPPNLRPEAPAMRPRRERELGPPVTVFVGNIMDRAPDIMMRQILGACGHVVSWKRVQAFGFCEFAGPDAGLRAIRLLHDMEVGNKKLVVKVDAKTKVVLDQFKAERRKKLKGGSSPLQDETPADSNESDDNDDYMDDSMKAMDIEGLQRIKMMITEHLTDFEIVPINSEEPVKTTVAKILSLDDAEIEESKRDLITREIGKFREVMKKQEEEKAQVKKKREAEEKEVREKREKREKERSKDDDNSSKHDGSEEPGSPHKSRSSSISHRDKRSNRSRSKTRERERERERDRDRGGRGDRSDRDREREREQREKERERERAERERERERDREREREREIRERERDREREREESRKSEREILRERDEEEESKDRKKNERRAREKDAAYQERLRAWEARERRKQKDYEKENEKKRGKREAREREAKRLKEFLEDYDDERDDAKYYKGKELSRRLEERALEAEADSRDRCAERQELQRLKEKLYSDNSFADPAAEFERLKAEREEQYKPKPVITIIDEEDEKPRHKEIVEMPPIETEPIDSDSDEAAHYDNGTVAPQEISRTPPRPSHHHHHRRHHRHHHRESVEDHHHEIEPIDVERESRERRTTTPPLILRSTTPPQPPPSHDEDSRTSLVSDSEKVSSSNFISFSMAVGVSRTDHGNKTPASPNAPVQNSHQSKRRGRIDVKDVFNNDDDDDSANNSKKRKLVPIDYGEEKKKLKEEQTKNTKEDTAKSQEEKRKHIKSLIDKIPTDKNALFGYQLDWAIIDNSLMEKRIRPWINKKIIEYIGEPEPTLVDFICSKVMAGSSPQGILDDVQMVLDEEAEVFVVKMWRLLIYEVEAKKMGLVK